MESGKNALPGGKWIQSFIRFVDELGRRRVWRTALAYGAACFALMQLGEILFPAFGAPDWALRVLVVSCLLGFPLVLCLSWVFDITAQGIRITRSQGEGHGGAGRILPRLALLAVTLSMIGGVGWWTVRDSIQGSAAEVSPSAQAAIPASAELKALTVRSLAVLPLDDFSEEDGDAYFTAGLHEELISQLSRSSSARVLSRTTVAQYDRKGKTMPTIAQDLGVEGVVEGSVYRSGDRVRITVQLIHGPSDTHLWADSYEGTTDDAIALQRQVAGAIARAIQAQLFGPEDSSSEVRLASTSQAEQEYLKGRYEQSKGTTEGLQSAIQHFQNAVAGDSSYAPAYAGMAGAQFLLGAQSRGLATQDSALTTEALRSLEKALTLDEKSPEAQAVLITMDESLPRGLPPEGMGRIKVVLDSGAVLAPSVALEASEFGRLMSHVAVRRDSPEGAAFPSRRVEVARRLAAASHFREAEQVLRGIVETWPDSQEAWDALEYLNAQQGRYEAVVQVREQRLETDASEGQVANSLQAFEEQVRDQGAEGYWAWKMAELEAKAREGEEVSSMELARASVAMGRTEAAYGFLDRALAEKDRDLLTLWTDPVWDVLRGEPKFKEILANLRSIRGHQPLPEPQ